MSWSGNVLEKFGKELYFVAFLILLKNFTTIGYHIDSTHRLTKRMNLEGCLAHFDVHHDTIIRTKESQSIGGRFIQGINLETLVECQHLCCETENCDVFIFEEKGEGYCYLFECGPPENFRCKFTRHANYTTAVLTPIRFTTISTTIKPHPTPVHPQILPSSLSQHELELTNLKQKPDLNSQQMKTTTTLIPPLGIRVGDFITTQKTVPARSSTCGRFQFQCHSGECIAVYNACDGIPQCEDASDEGPECPVTSVAGSKSVNGDAKTAEIVNMPVQLPNRVDDVIVPLPMVNDMTRSDKIRDQKNSPIFQTQIESVPRSYQQLAIQPPIINNREDPMSAPPVWPNRKVQEVSDIEHNSRIFNHKGGLQISTNNLGQPFSNQANNLYNSMQRDIYMQPDYQASYNNPMIQPHDHLVAPQNINWQLQQPQQPPLNPARPFLSAVNGQPVPQVKSVPVQQEAIVNIPMQTNQNQLPAVGVESVVPPATLTKTSGKLPHNELKRDHTDSNESEEYEEYTEKSTEPPKKKQRKHKKISNKDGKNKTKSEKTNTEKLVDLPVHEQYKMIKDSLEMEFVDHDGQSERPGGAVLSLTLGIIVTAALAVLVGCRMRTVGRRVRRSGKMPYAHDADFLVNGMYL